MEPGQRSRVAAARRLAMMLASLGILSMVPAGWALQATFERAGSGAPPRWALVLLLLGVLQLAYAAYLAQLPSRPALWVVTLAALAQAVVYALMLAVIAFSPPDHPLLLLLEGSDLAGQRSARLWCFAMLCLSSLFSYLGHRLDARWQIRGPVAGPPPGVQGSGSSR